MELVRTELVRTELIWTELIETELVGTELVGTKLVAELVTELEAQVEIQQLKALKVLLMAIHY